MCKAATSTENAHERCHLSKVNTLFVYLLMEGAYMCHDRNVRGMVGSKKRLRAKLDIWPNIRGICAHFPLVLQHIDDNDLI